MRGGTRLAALLASLALTLAACAGAAASDETTTTTSTPDPTTTEPATDHGADAEVDVEALAEANLGAAPFQDVAMAEAAGYVSTMESLGCFENPEEGGMGLHYLLESALDDTLEPGVPEALVYELDHEGNIVGLVAHEYLVPLEAWTEEEPPSLFGLEFHQHSVLPFWILHTWIWKDNPAGMFEDWNPKVRMCPEDAPVFGVDLP